MALAIETCQFDQTGVDMLGSVLSCYFTILTHIDSSWVLPENCQLRQHWLIYDRHIFKKSLTEAKYALSRLKIIVFKATAKIIFGEFFSQQNCCGQTTRDLS